MVDPEELDNVKVEDASIREESISLSLAEKPAKK